MNAVKNESLTFAGELIILVACLAATALAFSAVMGELDNIGRQFFAAVGM